VGRKAVPVVNRRDALVVETHVLDPPIEVSDDSLSSRLFTAGPRARSQLVDPLRTRCCRGKVEPRTVRPRKSLTAWHRGEPRAAEGWICSERLGQLDKS